MATIATESRAVQQLIDKDAIRDLVLCYSRAIDRQDIELLRDLYPEDATDTHGHHFDGSAADFCKFIEASSPHMIYSGHHACNHQIQVDGDKGCGEVYALALHVIPTPTGEQLEDLMAVRYIDNYRRCGDGKWRFSKRVVPYDMHVQRHFAGDGTMAQGADDPCYRELLMPLFRRGARA